MSRDAPLTAARQASARCDWGAAREAFESAAQRGITLNADDLAAWGNAAWWLGAIDEANDRLMAAHRAYLDADRPAEAANAALTLAVNYFLRGDTALGSGWVGRTARLVDQLPEGPVHGYVAYILEVEANFSHTGDDDVLAAGRRVQLLGRRFGDPNLVALGIAGEGRLWIRKGHPAKGLALLDEAMVSVVAGELRPEWAGNIYCNTIDACHGLGDLQRMRRWTSACEDWLASLPAAVLFAGICRVHRAQLLCIQGQWQRAEREASAVCADLAGISIASVAEAWYEVAEVRRLRGDLLGAESAYRSAHAQGRDPQPGLSLLRLAEGRVDEAAAALHAALLGAAGNALSRARLLAATVQVARAKGDTRAAREAATELGKLAESEAPPAGVSVLGALAHWGQGVVLLAEGSPGSALAALREACRIWHELGAPHEAAQTQLCLAETYRALGNHAAAQFELDAARGAFEALGVPVDSPSSGPGRAGGLSEREVEVLELVAAGRTNRDIARALSISEKTVARHLSNIFTKLQVSSRTEAARFAFDRGILPGRAT